MHRKILINVNQTVPSNIDNLYVLLNDEYITDNLRNRNIILDIEESSYNHMDLYGYDGELKYTNRGIMRENFVEIFELIDTMQIGRQEMIERQTIKQEIGDVSIPQTGGNNKLYSDDHPETTLKNTGFKDKKKALSTINLIKRRSIIYQKSVINTMLHRAKHHSYKTTDMNEAIKVFEDWLKKNKTISYKYEYLDIDTVKKYEVLAEHYDISHVARGLKKSTKTEKGFLVVYKECKGLKGKLPFIPVFKDRPQGMDYDSYREKFINSRLGQMKHAKINLYTPEGLPTKQHIILIMHAYSPDPKNLKKKIKLLNKNMKGGNTINKKYEDVYIRNKNDYMNLHISYPVNKNVE